MTSAYTSAISQPLPNNHPEAIPSLSSYLLTIAQRVKDSDERRAQLVDQKDRASARAAKWKQRASDLTVHIKSLELKARTPWWKRLKRPL